MEKRLISPTGVRIPDNLRQRLRIAAEENNRSMNAEIVYHLQRAMFDPLENEKADAPRA